MAYFKIIWDGFATEFNNVLLSCRLKLLYNAWIRGNDVVVVCAHYLFTPSGQFEESIIINTVHNNLNIEGDDCASEAGNEDHVDVIDLDHCERDVGLRLITSDRYHALLVMYT
jgi:hypothetical protein